MGSPKTRIGGREVEFLGMNWYYVDTGEMACEDGPSEQENEKTTTVSPYYTGGHCVQPKDK